MATGRDPGGRSKFPLAGGGGGGGGGEYNQVKAHGGGGTTIKDVGGHQDGKRGE